MEGELRMLLLYLIQLSLMASMLLSIHSFLFHISVCYSFLILSSPSYTGGPTISFSLLPLAPREQVIGSSSPAARFSTTSVSPVRTAHSPWTLHRKNAPSVGSVEVRDSRFLSDHITLSAHVVQRT